MDVCLQTRRVVWRNDWRSFTYPQRRDATRRATTQRVGATAGAQTRAKCLRAPSSPTSEEWWVLWSLPGSDRGRHGLMSPKKPQMTVSFFHRLKPKETPTSGPKPNPVSSRVAPSSLPKRFVIFFVCLFVFSHPTDVEPAGR